MLEVAEQETGSARRNDQIADVRNQKPERDQERIILELSVSTLPPQQGRDNQDTRHKQGVHNLEKLGQTGAVNTFHPDGRVSLPDTEIEVGEPAVGIGAANRRNEQRHLLVTGGYVNHWIPVPEKPAG